VQVYIHLPGQMTFPPVYIVAYVLLRLYVCYLEDEILANVISLSSATTSTDISEDDFKDSLDKVWSGTTDKDGAAVPRAGIHVEGIEE